MPAGQDVAQPTPAGHAVHQQGHRRPFPVSHLGPQNRLQAGPGGFFPEADHAIDPVGVGQGEGGQSPIGGCPAQSLQRFGSPVKGVVRMNPKWDVDGDSPER